MDAKERIIVALDVSTEKRALELVDCLQQYVGMFKIGLEFLNSNGPDIVRKIINIGGRVFLDGKFMDIPNTVAGAAKAVTRLSVGMFNVHTLGGLEMMRSAVQASNEEATASKISRPLVLGVTILTSIDEESMHEQLKIPGSLESQVIHLATLAEKAGLDGIIASAHEIKAIRRNISRRMLLVTPGIRPEWAAAQDQRRVTTPVEAILMGASYLVIGRPITQPPSHIGSSEAAAKIISDEIAEAMKRKEEF
jgi:orotidine-5'-phosphate decarboxylase